MATFMRRRQLKVKEKKLPEKEGSSREEDER